MSIENVCFTEVTIDSGQLEWQFDTEEEVEDRYGEIINVLATVAIELYQEEPDVRHLPFFQLPLLDQ